MNGKDIELTRRRVLGGIATVGVASAAAGAGTFAYFSDTETSEDNTVEAGTLNLTLSPSTGTGSFINIDKAKPGDSGYIVFQLKNDGNIDGSSIEITLTNLSESDNTGTEFETTPTANGGELDEILLVAAYVESSNPESSTGTYTGDYSTSSGTALITDSPTLSGAVGTTYAGSTDVSLTSGGTKYLVFEYTFPDVDDNTLQGDSVTFDIEVTLTQ